MLIEKQNRIRDPKHRRFVASLSCVITGNPEVQCAHISEGRYSMGLKASDEMCLPLSVEEHRVQHERGETVYWSEHGGITKARRLAKSLYEVSGNYEAAHQLIEEFRDNR